MLKILHKKLIEKQTKIIEEFKAVKFQVTERSPVISEVVSNYCKHISDTITLEGNISYDGLATIGIDVLFKKFWFVG